jgi:hypothetical protein
MRFTCEDLPLQLIIDFAAAERLPLRIRNGSRPRGYVPGDFNALEDFRIEVLSTTGARDLLLDGNTVAVGSDTPGRDRDLDFAQPGDMIVLDYGEHGHVQVVTRVGGNVIGIAQGNFPDQVLPCSGGDRDDPREACYLGVAVQEYHYVLNEGHWRYSRPGSGELVIQSHRGVVRRWNYMGWNPLSDEARTRMRGRFGVAESRRGW